MKIAYGFTRSVSCFRVQNGASSLMRWSFEVFFFKFIS